jgi:hypothetical protein
VAIHALASGAAILAITYVAIYQTELLTPVLDTLRHGPDR